MSNAMGLTMPFSKLNLLDADQIEAMREAFRRVCDILQLQCGREDQLTEVVGLKIVELARAGGRDPEKLCMDVLAALGTSSNEVTQRPPPETGTSVTANRNQGSVEQKAQAGSTS
jgi:hypothetical protein